MLTTIKINKDLQQQLKLKSVEQGVTQIELANRYILEGLKSDSTPNKPTMSLEDIEKLLKHDKPEGNNLKKLNSLITTEDEKDYVTFEKENVRWCYDIRWYKFFIISLINTKEKKHKSASRLLPYLEEETTTINSTVLVEVLNRLKKREYSQIRDNVIDLLYSMDYIHFLSPEDYNISLDYCKNYDFAVNYSDCTILKTIIDYNVDTIVSFDTDFDKINGIKRIYL